jgi:hypothetical protein
MERRSVEAIIESLTTAPARHLIAGGLAVVAHGLVRFTADVDLILDPDPHAITRALEALGALGYRPHATVALQEFADPERRSAWVREKGLTVFSLASSAHPGTEIDLFVECPLEFERAHAEALRLELRPGLDAVFVSRGDLIALKRRAGRPRDLEDIAGLERLAGASGEGA